MDEEAKVRRSVCEDKSDVCEDKSDDINFKVITYLVA